MSTATTLHADLLAHWKRDSDLSTDMGVKYTCARQWRARGRVPPRFWPKWIWTLKSRFDVEVTADELAAGYAASFAEQDAA